jgi:hypothetical protein
LPDSGQRGYVRLGRTFNNQNLSSDLLAGFDKEVKTDECFADFTSFDNPL